MSWPCGINPDHLRLRGELAHDLEQQEGPRGPPPPSRRARRSAVELGAARRTTSAFAESSSPPARMASTEPDHLRLRGELEVHVRWHAANAGPPPPSRRAPWPQARARARRRTTSAFAESSAARSGTPAHAADHLRLRGELTSDVYRLLRGTWTTSAFAESSRAENPNTSTATDHLRLRGELRHVLQPRNAGFGPPPPSRRAQLRELEAEEPVRTTSAFAESSRGLPPRRSTRTDHLRLRGELGRLYWAAVLPNGPPPPSRRAPQPDGRTTSAFAESSCAPRSPARTTTDHLRLRGELMVMPMTMLVTIGPPPPSRRAREQLGVHQPGSRTTSAFAESSDLGAGVVDPHSDHLRLRGELSASPTGAASSAGPPPPSRRARARVRPGHCRDRTTSAFAESSGTPPGGTRRHTDHLRLRGELLADLVRVPRRARTTSAFAESSATPRSATT